MKSRKALLVFKLFLILILSVSATSYAVDQNVEITVNPINELIVSNSDVALSINSASAGSDPVAATDTSTTMSYTTNQSDKKITAVLNNPYSTGLTLEVEVESDSGTSQDPVPLSTTAVDVITDLSNAADAEQQITYTASATVEASSGTQSQIVTFTITDQI